MQIQLSEEIEQALHAEATALGVSASEISARVLMQHAEQWRAQRAAGENAERFVEGYLGRMRRKNPDFDTTDPFAVDWQTLRSEGRRF
jgi:hypothetical protein